LRNATGEFICYIGADDEFHPSKLEIQLEQMEEKPDVAAVFSDIQVIDENGRPIHDEFLGKIFKQPNRSRFQWLNTFFYNSNCLAHPSVMARKAIYDRIGFMDNRLRQLPDLDYWVRLCLGHEIFVSPLVTVRNRLRTGGANVSTPDRTKVMRHRWEHIQILLRYCSLAKEDLFRVFPDLKPQYSDIEERYRHFALAQAANRSSSYVHRLFSLELMYQLMESEEFVSYVYSRYGYNHNSFYEASGSYLSD
jgi:glycosyltransferase involved in cell wall biosynthesis